MSRVLAFFAATVFVLSLAGFAVAQDDAQPKGDKGFKMLDANSDGKVTKEEYLAASQKRAEARWAKLDASQKGFLTREDFTAARDKAREKAQARKAKAAPQQ